jgi:hemerythrin
MTCMTPCEKDKPNRLWETCLTGYWGIPQNTSVMRNNEWRLAIIPNLAGHKAKHADLVRQATALQEKFASGNQHLNMKVMRFLKDWITNHIQKSDKDYMPYLQSMVVSDNRSANRISA